MAYPSDVKDEEWSFVAPYLCLMSEDAPQRDYALRDVFASVWFGLGSHARGPQRERLLGGHLAGANYGVSQPGCRALPAHRPQRGRCPQHAVLRRAPADAAGHNLGALCIIINHQPRELSALEQQRLQALAGIVMQLLELRLALAQRPEHTVAVWVQLYDQLDTSLTRLDTLAELSRWEEPPTTPGALHYQQARQEEAALVVEQLAQQVRAALTTVRQA